MNSKGWRWCRWLLLALSMQILFAFESIAQEATTGLKLSPLPDWIKPQALPGDKPAPEDKIQNGVYYVLFDHQIKVSENQPVENFHHLAQKVVNQSGLQDTSNISVSYDPSYQTLRWHHLNIIRDGKIIDRHAEVKVAVLHREKELEQSMYNGRLTSNIILPDLRVGDLVDYSYSIQGQNPIYAGHFATMEYLQWAVPLAKYHFLLDWGRAGSLQTQAMNTDLKPAISLLGGRSIYEFNLADVATRKSNSQAPSWHDPFARYYFSDVKTWSQVIEWALPLYEKSIKSSPAIKQIAADLQHQSNNPLRQASLALHYVQNNIRYLGVEMGTNSHQPSLAQDTLARRYGDCKDKAVLLISILNELGIEAAPVLVDTDIKKELINYLPSINTFDHVIVYLRYGGKAFWIDPTREYQKGDIEVLYQNDYGYGLVISRAFHDLTKMNIPRITTEKITEEIDASGPLADPVSYKIHSVYSGYDAEVQRSNFLDSNISKKSEQYLNFYKDYYDHIESQENLTFEDNDTSGVFHLYEHYRINKFWVEDKDKSYTATFYANEISSVLTKPDVIIRTDPYYLREREIKQTIKVKLDDADWDLKSGRFDEKNPFFEFSRVIYFDKKNHELSLDFFFKTLTDSVPPEKIDAYMEARKRVNKKVEYSIYENPSFNAIKDTGIGYKNLTWILIGAGVGLAYLLALIMILNNWYSDKSRLDYLNESRFYPISPVKFTVLSLATLSAYLFYWFYRNWSYIKRVDQSNLMPGWRSFFSVLWFYPFYQRVVAGSESAGVAFLPAAKWAAFTAAFLYFIFSMLSSLDAIGFFCLLLSLALCLALALHINKIPQADERAYQNNSRWLLRHSLLVICGLPLVLWWCGRDVALLPGSSVISGERLFAHDLRFMQRHKIVPADEKILYFYSTALADFHEAGGGFTEKTVFTYWHDDAGKLVVKSIPFAKVSTITENKGGNPSLNIQDEDNDDFTLYLANRGVNNHQFVEKIMEQWHVQQNAKQKQDTKQEDKKQQNAKPQRDERQPDISQRNEITEQKGVTEQKEIKQN